ncbi:hypothetical protein [Kangiella sp. M94]
MKVINASFAVLIVATVLLLFLRQWNDSGYKVPEQQTVIDTSQAESEFFSCSDTMVRADGQPHQTLYCRKESEYCYMASGGAAVSHGVECRKLPWKDATCDDLPITDAPGGICKGNAQTGIRVEFVFP